MVIDVYTPASTRRHRHLFTADALTIKLIIVILFGVSVFSASAFIRNSQRNLDEDIGRIEQRKTELLRELQAARGAWNRSSNATAIAERLASRGFNMGIPDGSRIVYASPRHDPLPGAIALPKPPSAVASR